MRTKILNTSRPFRLTRPKFEFINISFIWKQCIVNLLNYEAEVLGNDFYAFSRNDVEALIIVQRIFVQVFEPIVVKANLDDAKDSLDLAQVAFLFLRNDGVEEHG